MKKQIADLEFEPLIKSEAIDERIKAIGLQLNNDYKHTIPVFVGVLNGSFLFIADLIKQIDIPCEITFTKLASYYGGTKSTLKIRDDIDFSVDIKGREVVVIEDIVDLTRRNSLPDAALHLVRQTRRLLDPGSRLGTYMQDELPAVGVRKEVLPKEWNEHESANADNKKAGNK